MQQNWDSGCTTKKVCSKEPPSESFTESNELETRPGDILKYSCSGQEYAIYMIRKNPIILKRWSLAATFCWENEMVAAGKERRW